MGQREVLEFLTKNKGKEFTSMETAGELKENSSSVIGSYKKLRKGKFVKFAKRKVKNRMIYKYWV